MTNAAPLKRNGTSGTNGTMLICNRNPGPVGGGVNGTSGTGTAAVQAAVPLVPLAENRTGPEKTNDINAVPLVPLVPPETENNAPDLVAAFEAIFAAAETSRAAQDDAGRGRDGATPLAADLDAFEERTAIREHDGGETREEAERAAAAEHGFAVPDPARLAALLAERGPMTQGAAGAALGWGGTRAWQAEDALRRRRLIEYDRIGRAAVAAAWTDFEAMNDPYDPRAWT